MPEATLTLANQGELAKPLPEPISAKERLLTDGSKMPPMPSVRLENVPEPLASTKCFCLWEWEWRAKETKPKWAKMPRRLNGSGLTSKAWNDPVNLVDLPEALSQAARFSTASRKIGVGIVCPAGMAIEGAPLALDFDKVLDENGAITNPTIAALVDATKGAVLWERSASGTGLHAIGLGLNASDGPKKFSLTDGGDAEILFEGRYCALTADWLHEIPSGPIGSLNGILEAVRKTGKSSQSPTAERKAVARSQESGFREYLAEQARRYVEKIEPSISGQFGHKRLMEVVTVLKHGYGYGDSGRAGAWESDGRAIFEGFNHRGDPESEKQIEHKWISAKPSAGGKDLYADCLSRWEAHQNGKKASQKKEAAPALQGDSGARGASPPKDPEAAKKLAIAAMQAPEQIEPLKPAVWLWDDVMPKGEVGFLAGWPGAGKSTALGGLIASLTQPGGYCGPCGSLPGLRDEQGSEKCLWISCEERAPKIKARLEESGADLSKVRIVTAFKPSEAETKRYPAFPDDLDLLRLWLAEFKPSLVVLDSMSGLFQATADTAKGQQLRGGVLNALAVMAEEFACSILLVTHFTKSSMMQKDGPSFLKSEGAVGLSGACRFCLELIFHPEDAHLPKVERRRILRTTKTQDAAEGFTVPFTLQSATTASGARVQIPKWHDGLWLEDELPPRSIAPGPKAETTQRAEAEIVELLRRRGEPIPLAELNAELKELSVDTAISERTFRRAREILGQKKVIEQTHYAGKRMVKLLANPTTLPE